jgi:hypothetical protein
VKAAANTLAQRDLTDARQRFGKDAKLVVGQPVVGADVAFRKFRTTEGALGAGRPG